MAILKKGSRGEEVKKLQRLLNAKGFMLTADGIFGKKTLAAVRAFQAQNLDIHGRPLVVDGIVGPITRWSLNNNTDIYVAPVIDFTKMPNSSYGGSKIGRQALKNALDEIKDGAREIGGNNRGPFVAKYLQPAGLVPPQFWCASFVSWCFLRATGDDVESMPFDYSAGARNIFNQFKRKGWTFTSNNANDRLPEPGDIVTWWRVKADGWQGHIGLVHHYHRGFLYTIEGNRSSRVEGFDYKLIQMEKLLGFGRAE